MTGFTPDEATLAQILAADPDRSTWLTANAGSGKTRVLTDRVARLLLGGTRPERILCLTYTKAAATEMQNRLLARLGEWAMLPDAELRAQLERLGAAPGPDLAPARRLFAQAIEAPGGLKVQTIHSFCGAILRRFPLEAGVPHGFAELDDRSASQLRNEIVEEMARDAAPEIDDLTGLTGDYRLDDFLASVTRGFDKAPDPAAIWALADLPEGYDEATLLAEVFLGGEADFLRDTIAVMHEFGGPNDQRDARRLARGDWDAPGQRELAILEHVFLNGPKAKSPFGAKLGGVPTKGLRNSNRVTHEAALDALMLRVEAARPRRVGLGFARKSLSLNRFAHRFSGIYQARKAARGWLDFDDLIHKTARLLSRPDLAQWVLFRLDGGIDHILVDEAQDTSPEQWQVIASLTEEMTAGLSDRRRTLFVVGDPKQSIYSFQGADIRIYESRRDYFDEAFAQVQAPMARRTLAHSFRSSPAILRLVDAVFDGPAGEGLGEDAPHHKAFHEDRPGRVDLWPVFAKPDAPEPREWDDPLDLPEPDSSAARLADALALQIKQLLDRGEQIPGKDGPRPLGPGDILILVQSRRDVLFGAIIRALKVAGLPVAGADRMRLGAEMAVRDIRALLDVLATPEDDLALAAVLRSPLIGLDEQELYALAHGRSGFLIEALRGSDHERAKSIIFDLMDQGEMRPYELISRLLIRHGGRAALLARLGPEAEDGIDELLGQALAYERVQVPTLTGFLVWLAGDDVEVKRQPGSGAGLIQVMTVHGAKGLERPVVILPQTAQRKLPRGNSQARLEEGLTVWRGAAGERVEATEAAEVERAARQIEERRRLLYVALTRAESWLIIAAAGSVSEADPLASWYGMVRDGLGRVEGLETSNHITPEGTIRRFSWGAWPPPVEPVAQQEAPPDLPDLDALRRAPAPLPRPVLPRIATGLGGAKALPTPGGADPEEAMRYGTRLHLLLEQLDPDAADASAAARDILSSAEGGLPTPDELAALLADLAAIRSAPDLAGLFDTSEAVVLTEAPIHADLAGFGRLRGSIDRLVLRAGQVVAVDYKTNARIPDRPENVPLGILRQMAAYECALRACYPDRDIQCEILWTAGPSRMALPSALLGRVWAELLDEIGAG